MTDSLFIFAEITPKPEHLADARDAIMGIVEETRKESGCRSFTVLEGVKPGAIYLFEEWDDQGALDDHYAKPYTAAVFAQYENWLAKPPKIKKLSLLG
ncbi:MAG: putative quinol monooxygenase [Pseudomonadota bacterium]